MKTHLIISSLAYFLFIVLVGIGLLAYADYVRLLGWVTFIVLVIFWCIFHIILGYVHHKLAPKDRSQGPSQIH
jgi:hypothetical protein